MSEPINKENNNNINDSNEKIEIQIQIENFTCLLCNKSLTTKGEMHNCIDRNMEQIIRIYLN